MKRRIDDIIPPAGGDKRRSIRKVSMDRMVRRKGRERVRGTKQETDLDLSPQAPPVRATPSRFGLWIIVGVSILVLFFGFSLLFSGAKLVVIPKQRSVLVDATFEAFKTPRVGALGYEIMTIEIEGTNEVYANTEEFVEEKASGKITIYNNFNTSKQRLIKNTRFETPEGLIYRINESTVVPGQRIENKKVVPGSVEVVVYADEVGEKYNMGLGDFTIPWFKGDPRFDDFYARSKTEMTGGFVGEKKIVSKVG